MILFVSFLVSKTVVPTISNSKSSSVPPSTFPSASTLVTLKQESVAPSTFPSASTLVTLQQASVPPSTFPSASTLVTLEQASVPPSTSLSVTPHPSTLPDGCQQASVTKYNGSGSLFISGLLFFIIAITIIVIG